MKWDKLPQTGNLSSGEWSLLTPSGTVPDPRVAHSATAIDGQIYVFGGRSGKEIGEGAYADLHAFDAQGTVGAYQNITPCHGSRSGGENMDSPNLI